MPTRRREIFHAHRKHTMKPQRENGDPVEPLFCCGCSPNQDQILHNVRDRQFLGNDQHASTTRRPGSR